MFRPKIPDAYLKYYYYRKIALKYTVDFLKSAKPDFIQPQKYYDEIQNRIINGKQSHPMFTQEYKTVIDNILLINKKNKKEMVKKYMFFKNYKITLSNTNISKNGLFTATATTKTSSCWRVKAFGDVAKKLKKLDDDETITVNAHVQVEMYENKYYISLVIDEICE